MRRPGSPRANSWPHLTMKPSTGIPDRQAFVAFTEKLRADYEVLRPSRDRVGCQVAAAVRGVGPGAGFGGVRGRCRGVADRDRGVVVDGHRPRAQRARRQFGPLPRFPVAGRRRLHARRRPGASDTSSGSGAGGSAGGSVDDVAGAALQVPSRVRARARIALGALSASYGGDPDTRPRSCSVPARSSAAGHQPRPRRQRPDRPDARRTDRRQPVHPRYLQHRQPPLVLCHRRPT